MGIPSSFYIRFWFRNSLLAIGTGFVIGYFSSIVIAHMVKPFAVALIGSLVFLFVYQGIALSQFIGLKRGSFQYAYRESLIDDLLPGGIPDILSFEWPENYHNLINAADKETDRQSRFMKYMGAARIASLGDDDAKAKEALKMALVVRPEDAVANFRMAVYFERAGEALLAIEYYEKAMDDPSIDTEELKKFIARQAEWVRINGPRQSPPNRGLKHQLQ